MNLRTHLVSGVAAGVLLSPWLGRRSLLVVCGAALADLDLYLYYVARHRDLSLRKAMRYYRTLTGSRESAVKVLHLPIVPLAALACGRRSRTVGSLGVGLAIHLTLDGWGKWRFAHLVRLLRARSAGRCEHCGESSLDASRMEPHFSGVPTDRPLDARRWLLLCRHCNEERNRGAEPLGVRL